MQSPGSSSGEPARAGEPGLVARPARRRRRDRRGRGPRGMVVPPSLPAARTRSEQFDDRVLDAVEQLEQRWAKELDGVEFAVEDVPAVPEGPGSSAGSGRADSARGGDRADGLGPDDSVLEDGAIPLARLIPARREGGRALPARIVLYRRPLEARAADQFDLDDLVRDVVIEQVASLLGLHPDELDPPQ